MLQRMDFPTPFHDTEAQVCMPLPSGSAFQLEHGHWMTGVESIEMHHLIENANFPPIYQDGIPVASNEIQPDEGLCTNVSPQTSLNNRSNTVFVEQDRFSIPSAIDCSHACSTSPSSAMALNINNNATAPPLTGGESSQNGPVSRKYGPPPPARRGGRKGPLPRNQSNATEVCIRCRKSGVRVRTQSVTVL